MDSHLLAVSGVKLLAANQEESRRELESAALRDGAQRSVVARVVQRPQSISSHYFKKRGYWDKKTIRRVFI